MVQGPRASWLRPSSSRRALGRHALPRPSQDLLRLGPLPTQDAPMTQPPLRCHLLIGPPASGKTTLARDLAPLLRSESGEHALVLSTDAIGATPSDVARMPQ
jgi:hypothetical protein